MRRARLTFCYNAGHEKAISGRERATERRQGSISRGTYIVSVATLLNNYSNNSSIHPNGESARALRHGSECMSYMARSVMYLGVRRGPYHLTCHVAKPEVVLV